MCGCCSARDRVDFADEPLGADHGREFRLEDLDGHLAAVPQVFGEIDGRHAAGAELALDPVAVGQGGGEWDLRQVRSGRDGWPAATGDGTAVFMERERPEGTVGRVGGEGRGGSALGALGLGAEAPARHAR